MSTGNTIVVPIQTRQETLSTSMLKSFLPEQIPKGTSDLHQVQSAFFTDTPNNYGVAVGYGPLAEAQTIISRNANNPDFGWGSFPGEKSKFVDSPLLTQKMVLASSNPPVANTGAPYIHSTLAQDAARLQSPFIYRDWPSANFASYGSYKSCPNCVTGKQQVIESGVCTQGPSSYTSNGECLSYGAYPNLIASSKYC